MAKLYASETAMFCTWAAVQTLGGWGYSREYPVEKWMRDAKLEEIEEGTSDIQRLIISRRLRLAAPRAATIQRRPRPQALFDPRSIAVVGASNEPASGATDWHEGAPRRAPPRRLPGQPQRRRDPRAAHRGAPWTSSRSPAELVVVAVPEAAFEATVDDGRWRQAPERSSGSRPGWASSGPPVAAREQEVVERVRTPARCCWARTASASSTPAELDIGWSELPRGSIGLVSQSGNLALELGLLVAEVGLGFRASPRSATRPTSRPADARPRPGRPRADPGHRPLRGGLPRRTGLRARLPERDGGGEAGRPARGRGSEASAGRPLSHRSARERARRGRGGVPAAGIELVHTPRELVDVAQAFLVGDLPAAGAWPSSETVEVTASSPPISRRQPASEVPALSTALAEASPGRSAQWPRPVTPSILPEWASTTSRASSACRLLLDSGRGRRGPAHRLLRRLRGVRSGVRGRERAVAHGLARARRTQPGRSSPRPCTRRPGRSCASPGRRARLRRHRGGRCRPGAPGLSRGEPARPASRSSPAVTRGHRGGLLRAPRAARRRGRAVRRGSQGRDHGRSAAAAAELGFPGRAQGARPRAQVGRRAASPSGSRTRRPSSSC